MGYENNGQNPRQHQGGSQQGREANPRRAQRQGYDLRDPRAASGSGYSGYADARRRQAATRQPSEARRGESSGYAAQPRYETRQRTAGQEGQDVSRYNDLSRYRSAAGGYNSLYESRQSQGAARAQSSNTPKVIAIVVCVLAIVALLWAFVVPKPFEVTVNDKEVTMNPGSTVATLVDEGHARPSPGNLVAVDGSLISTGEGERFSATIDGKQAASDAPLSQGMVVEIGNGGDVTEDYTSSEEVVPFDTVNDDMSFEAYWNASIHLLQDGKDGVATTKTGVISGKTVQEVTQPAVSGGYHTYTAQPSEPVIALTFDDGPWAGTTNEILDILEANGAKATFFTIGNQVAEQAEAVRRADGMGCEVCTHTWDHADGTGQGVDLTLMSPDEQVAEVTQGYEAIANVIGREPAHIMRAPGGNFHDDLITTLWPYLDAEIGWDVDTEDWARPGTEAIVSRILSVEPGQVILMHDGGGEREQTVEALRQALPVLVERGYKFVTISELLSYGIPGQESAAEPIEAIETVAMEEA